MTEIAVQPQAYGTAEKQPLSRLTLMVLIVLSVFESVRSNMMLSEVITRFKDVDIVFFFFFVLRESGYRLNRDFFLKNAYGWMLAFVLLTLPVTYYSINTQFGAEIQSTVSLAGASYLRMLYFCFLTYVLIEYFHRRPEDGPAMLNIFIISCCFFVVFNIVGYFYHFPFMRVFRPHNGRFSSGYPTSDALMLIFAIVALAANRAPKEKSDYLQLLLLAVGVVGNVTGSGLIAAVVLSLAYVALNIKRSPAKVLSLILAGCVTMAAILGAIFLYLMFYYPKLLKFFLAIGQMRWTSLFTGGGTIAVRVKEFTDQGKYMEGWLDQLIGVGSRFGFIEIQYAHVFVTWGILGSVLFLLTIVQNFTMARSGNFQFCLYANLVWIIGGGVLVTTYLFPLFVPFALLMSVSATQRFAAAHA
ncbi:MAG TPA: hypothetical protein V6C72_20055 [Chroococcales cyanobacterium]